MKLKLTAIALVASMALSCDDSFGCDLLDRMLGRAGCSSRETPKVSGCGCGGGLVDKVVGKHGEDMVTYDANSGGADCGCESAPAPSCGCGAPAAAIEPVADCGCSAPTPMPTVECGCSAAPSAAASVSDCGCGSPTPIADPSNAVAKKTFSLGVFNKFQRTDHGSPAPVPAADCGCTAPVMDHAPSAVTSCGCNGAGGEEKAAVRGKLTLLDRLRGNRIPRTREGVVIGSEGSDGCNSPCPQPQSSDCGCGAAAPQEAPQAAPCTSCAGGEFVYRDAQPVGGCTSCGTSEAQVIYGEPTAVAPATAMGTGEADIAPVVPATEGVIESVDETSGAAPVVDPGAFIPRRRTTVGS